MSNKVNFEILRQQFEDINYAIEEKEKKIREFNLSTFTLNPEITKIAQEIKELNEQRKVILTELKSMED